jgi:hypothetical protein
MASWKTFSAEVMRSVPRGASMAERSRALKAAGKMWREGEGRGGAMRPMRRSSYEPLERNPFGMSNTSALLYGVGAVAAYLYVIRPNQSRIASWFAMPVADTQRA